MSNEEINYYSMDNKRKFIEREIWSLTFSAAFQRAKVYVPDVSDLEKKKWRTTFSHRLVNEILPQYMKGEIDGDCHIQQIEEVQRISKSKIFNGGGLNFGVAQKILNLYLKYLWCLGELKYTPPHFPVDRRIQEILKLKPVIAWTGIKYSLDYLGIINRATNKLKTTYKGKYKNIAEMELDLFTRSADESKVEK